MKNIHLQHVEDLCFTKADPFIPLNILEQVYHFLCGINTSNTRISVKWDGAPAFICGKNPENQRFFVGTKSVFSGKINYCHADILENHESKGLQITLMELYDRLWYCDIPQIIQGDVLWTKYRTGGEISFQLNTLNYKIPHHFIISKYIRSCQIGCVFHTTYTGNKIKDMEANFGANAPENAFQEQIYCFEPELPEEEMIAPGDWGKIETAISSLRHRAIDISKTALATLGSNDLFQLYINDCIRNDKLPYSNEFLSFVIRDYTKHQETLKTEKGKNVVFEKMTKYMAGLLVYCGDIFNYYLDLMRLKVILVRELDKLNISVNIYLPDGTPCGHEGYVVKSLGYTIKLVDRYTFSKANFNYDMEWKRK